MTIKTMTLTRWHHVADRLNGKIKELESSAQSTLNGTTVTAFQGGEQVRSLEKRRAVAIEQVAFARRLIATVGAIREALAHANAQHGVSAQLSRLDALNREIRMLGMLGAIDNDAKIQVSHLDAHFQALNGADAVRTRLVNAVSVALLPEDQQDAWNDERDALQARAHALSDTINDLNHQTLSLDLSDDVARIAGV